MNMNEMMQFLRQIPGKLGSYSSVSNQNDLKNVAFIRQLQREVKKQDTLQIPFDELKLIVFDLETTGFHPHKGDKIISIGAVKIEGAKVIENDFFYSLVYHEQGPSLEIEQLTGITKAQLQEAPPIEEVLNSFFQYVQSSPLVAHHSHHEKNFMQHVTWTMLKTRFEHRIIDTSFLTKINEPAENLLSLDDWCDYYNIGISNRHHALHDAIATAKLWVKSAALLQEKGFHHLKDVYSYLASQK